MWRTNKYTLEVHNVHHYRISGLPTAAALPPPGTQRNFSNVTAGSTTFTSIGGPLTIVMKGYGIDLDGDGKFQGDRDGVLAFDVNKDGKIDQGEIAESRRRLNLMAGNDPDLKSPCKRHKAEAERSALLKQYDSDGDGKLNSYEISAAGGKVLVDSNRDGTFSSSEAQDVRNLRTAGGRFRLDEVDPRGNYSQVKSQNWFDQGGRPGWSDWGQSGNWGGCGGHHCRW